MLLHGNDIIILGDLNCNILDDTVDSRTLKELCAIFNLTQLVKEPTRITETKRSLIDDIMTTDPTLAESCSVITSSISDQNLVEVTLKISQSQIRYYKKLFRVRNRQLLRRSFSCSVAHGILL